MKNYLHYNIDKYKLSTYKMQRRLAKHLHSNIDKYKRKTSSYTSTMFLFTF